MANIGIVIATDKNIATVEKCKSSICDTCVKKNKIGACEVCSEKENQVADRYVAYNGIAAEIGDKVEFVKNRRASVAFAIVTFVAPLVCAFVTYLISSMITDDPGVSGRIAILFFALAMIVAGLYSYKASQRRCEYTISAVYDEE